MSTTVRLPKLGLTMDEATVVSWAVAIGDLVAAGQALLEVETDKATLEVEAPAGGYLRRQLVAVGEKVALGSPLAILSATLAEPIEETTEVAPEAEGNGGGASKDAAQSPRVAKQAELGGRGPVDAVGPVSPAIRRRAGELGIDLSQVRGSGPGGRIREADLDAAAGALAQTGPRALLAGSREVSTMSRVRRTTAERMVASATDIPQFSLRRRVAVEAVLAAKQRLVASSGEAVRLSLTDFLLRALARALMAHPALRGRLEGTLADGVVSLSPTADIGLAVDTPSGLLVPVLADLGEKSVAEIAELRSEAVAGARLGRLSARFAGEPVFSLSNLGPFAVDDFTALVSPGETGVLAVGAVRPEPVAEDGHVQVRPMLTLTFSFDHRLIDGAEGARFAARVAEELAASANPAAPKPGS